jgi:hypothetical protein
LRHNLKRSSCARLSRSGVRTQKEETKSLHIGNVMQETGKASSSTLSLLFLNGGRRRQTSSPCIRALHCTLTLNTPSTYCSIGTSFHNCFFATSLETLKQWNLSRWCVHRSLSPPPTLQYFGLKFSKNPWLGNGLFSVRKCCWCVAKIANNIIKMVAVLHGRSTRLASSDVAALPFTSPTNKSTIPTTATSATATKKDSPILQRRAAPCLKIYNSNRPRSSLRRTTIWMVLALLGPLKSSSSSSSFFVSATWVDPDTPEDARTTQPYTAGYYNTPKKKAATKKAVHHRRTPAPSVSHSPTHIPTVSPTLSPTGPLGTYQLVYSDEFNAPFRTFEDGVDPRWTALEKNDYTNNALHYYSTANAETNQNGELVITTEAADTDIIGFDDVLREHTHVTKHFKSAMLQSWNKFCFTGGIVEAEVILPGQDKVGGLWPAFWLLGNLARHTYVGSSEHIWPWSSTVCTEKSMDSQRVSGCDRVGHYGMPPGIGRGAPEIDIFEVQGGPVGPNEGVFLESSVGQPFMSASFQVAPGRASIRPGNGYWPGPGQWYEGLRGGNQSALNINFYGNYNHFRGDYDPAVSDYWSDAISFNRQLEKKHFNGSHVYRLEWDVPTKDKDGYLHWFLDGELVLSIDGSGLRASGEG